MTEDDPYREWDAAYVLGALSADDQKAFEQHLADCDHCTTAVTELAEIPGLLATVPADHAVTSLDEPASSEPAPPPKETFARLASAASARQRRVHRRMLVGVAAVVVLVVGLVVPVMFISDTVDGNSAPEAIELDEADPTPLSASVRLVEQPWGTQLEGECRYEQPAADEGRRYSSGQAGTYAMYVVAVDGSAHRVASWTASPGMTVSPQGTVELRPDQIDIVQIRSVDTGRVLLEHTA